ncbi:MAG: 5'/3'-nucleotidase SurE [Candidatus Anstonellales archaeon]
MILVTNDDGYTESAKTLMDVAKEFDEEVVGIFPERQSSAVSKSMTFHKPARVNRIAKNVYVINGTPADCVYFAIGKYGLKKLDLVISGVNLGDNTSLHSIFSSGTVGGAIEAALFGIPAMAFSRVKKGHWKEPDWKWKDREVMAEWIKRIIKNYRVKKGMVLNVNLPERFTRKTRIVFAKPQPHRLNPRIVKRIDPDGTPYYWLTGVYAKPEKGKDVYYVSRGDITITVVEPKKIISHLPE